MFAASASSRSFTHEGISEAINKAYDEGLQQGRKAAQTLLVKPDPSFSQQWSILVSVYKKAGSEEIQKVCKSANKIPLSKRLSAFEAFKELLMTLPLAAEQVEPFCELLIANKLLLAVDRGYLYEGVACFYEEKKQYQQAAFFYKKSLEQSTQPVNNKHSLCINIARMYKAVKQPVLASEYFSKAWQMEKSGILAKPYMLQYGVMQYLVGEFEKYVQKNIREPDIGFLEEALKLDKNNEKIIKAAKNFINQFLSLPDKDKHSQLLGTVFAVAQQLSLVDQQQALLQVVETLSEQECNNTVKAAYYLHADQYDKTIALALSELKKVPDNVDALRHLASAYYKQENFIAAEAVLLNLIQLPISEAQKEKAYGKLAEIYVNLICMPEAVLYAEKTLEINPRNVAAVSNRIRAYMLSHSTMAKRLFKKAKKDFPNEPAIAECETFFLAASGRLDSSSVRDNSQMEDQVNNVVVEVYSLIAQHNYDLAETKALELLNLSVDHMSSHVLLGQIYNLKHNPEKAVYHLTQALNPNNRRQLYPLLQNAYFSLGDYKMASEASLFVIQHENSPKPSDVKIRLSAYKNLMYSMITDERMDEGIAYFESFLAQPHLLQEREEVALIEESLANLYYLKHDLAQAELHAKKSLTLHVYYNANLCFLQGLLCLFLRKAEAAIASFKRIVKMEPQNGAALCYLGMAYYYSGDKEQAQIYLCQAIDIYPFYLTALTHLLSKDIEKWLGLDVSDSASSSVLETDSDSDLEDESVSSSAGGAVQEESKEDNISVLATLRVEQGSPILSEEVVRHQFFQLEKRRHLINHHHASELHAGLNHQQGWFIPTLGFVSVSDSRVTKVAYREHGSSHSHLYAMLHSSALKLAVKDENILGKWQEVLNHGQIVGRSNRQGIKPLKESEVKKIGSGYFAKLKLLGLYGGTRAYAKLIPGAADPTLSLLCFDKVRNKAHS